MSIIDLGSGIKSPFSTGDDVFDSFKSAASEGKAVLTSTGEEILPEAKRQYEKFIKSPTGYTGDLINNLINYQDEHSNVQIPRGTSTNGTSLYNNQNRGVFNGSLSNKIHLIRVSNKISANDTNRREQVEKLATTFYELCSQSKGVSQYDVDDFLYVKELGLPINRLITLRRFPYGVTDNIFDKFNQSHPDISRMVSFFHEEGNRLEDILSMSFGLRWKELVAEYEQASMNGDQSGLSGFAKRIMKYIDPIMSKDKLRGENQRNYDPKYDQNKVYGPVDAVNSTHIREVGFDYDNSLEISFKYELRSVAGRTPEYAMRDILANALATTFNNGKFWGGARYWIGERPTQYLDKFQGILNPSTVSEWAERAREGFTSIVGQFGAAKGSKIQALKNMMGNVLSNAMAVGLGMILDNVGRASIVTTNSLLSGEPIGNWHLTVGHPQEPIMCIGNLMCIGVDLKFPTEELSYGNFPTQMEFIVKLKPAMAKDKGNIESMFNLGMQRIYHNPKKVKISKNIGLEPSQRRYRTFDNDSENGVESEKILHTFNETFDFSPTKLAADGQTTVAQNTEILIDGQDYVSNIDYDKALMAEKPELDSDEKRVLSDLEARQNQQNSGNYNAMNNGGSGQYSGDYQTGVIGDPSTKRIADTIKQKESGNDYGAQAKTSSASGAYQFIDGTWASLTKKYGIGTQYKHAKDAPPGVQDQIADYYIKEIMRDNNGDVTKIPIVWFTGNKYGQMSQTALAANKGLNAQKYQNGWIKIYNTKT